MTISFSSRHFFVFPPSKQNFRVFVKINAPEISSPLVHPETNGPHKSQVSGSLETRGGGAKPWRLLIGGTRLFFASPPQTFWLSAARSLGWTLRSRAAGPTLAPRKEAETVRVGAAAPVVSSSLKAQEELVALCGAVGGAGCRRRSSLSGVLTR